jgi:hypothetical protein
MDRMAMPKAIEGIVRIGNTRPRLVISIGSLTLAALLLVGVTLACPNAKVRTFTGEIQDGTCAGTAEHVERECATKCVRSGAKWVLYDPVQQEIYQLSDQETPIRFAARQVTVLGILDKRAKTIHVVKISATSTAPPRL